MDPSGWLGIGGGLLSLFGGGGGGVPSHMLEAYAKYSQMLDEAMRLYNSTDLVSQDKATVESFKKRVEEDATTQMDNYNARVSANMPGMTNYSDTEKTRTTGRFAENASRATADLESDLNQSRTLRKKALLPDMSGYAGGFDVATRLDQYYNNRNAANQDAWFQVAQGLMPFLKRGKKSGAPVGGGPVYGTDETGYYQWEDGLA